MVTKTHEEGYDRGQYTTKNVEYDEKAYVPALPGYLGTVTDPFHGARGR